MEDSTNINIIINAKILCFNNANFILSAFLFFTTVWYKRIPLTAKAIIAGINSKLCKNIVVTTNKTPFEIPSICIIAEMVYPRQNPLNSIIANTIGIPIKDAPTNHNARTNKKFWISEFFNNSK